MALDGEVLSMLLCTCLDCQKATGTGHSAAAMVHESALQLSGPVRSHAVTAASGATLSRHFCSGCGTPLFAVSSRSPQTRLIAVGFFGAETDWFEPRHVLFARSHNDWDVLPPIPRHATYPERPER
ncbi:GFA family protein [Arsenicitalea aurantiaca]|nr:GFA family protein [Arsenicitalea aurantiaca]